MKDEIREELKKDGVSLENPNDFKENQESYVFKQNSFIPMLEECERFINFLNSKFSLNLPENYVITINKASKSQIGYFMPKENGDHFINSTQDLNNINLNTLYLKENSPYECLTHELAHFINHIKEIKDCSSNQYHNKHFKTQAEKLLLNVERTKKGYNHTSESEAFNLMLEEFKPNKEVFNICQAIKTTNPTTTRNKLYICSCGIKVRCATELNAVCNDCNSEFIKQGDEEDD